MSWQIETVLSVSALNVVLNTLVFFLVYIAGILAALAVGNLVKLELRKHGKAPISTSQRADGKDC